MKTKFGITAGALAAIAYLCGFFSGYLVLALIVGYVFIVEENDWLKINVLKALVIMLCFSVLSALIGFIPNLLDLVASLFRIWGKGATISGNSVVSGISSAVSFIQSILNICEKVLMLVLALFAAKLKTVKIAFIDNIIEKAIIKG
ncbi:MAG: hypothetical protein J5712_01410 [Lachnospiraceae bacterium]|nr:hypothetical protein [Lachnospiraceae bacterium]MBO4558714.1 hypothetical protein [Lachnospiraceae bacterium]MBR5732614.1 hypothetical protein [Lachnospiraceae bacterium]